MAGRKTCCCSPGNPTGKPGAILQRSSSFKSQSVPRRADSWIYPVSTKEQTVGQQRSRSKNLPQTWLANRWYEDEGECVPQVDEKRRSGSILIADLQPGDIVVAWRYQTTCSVRYWTWPNN